MLDWPVFLWRVWRDQRLHARGIYPFDPSDYRRVRTLSPQLLAFACDANGGVPYVMWGEAKGRNLIDLDAYRGIKDGDVVWIRIEDLGAFNQRILPGVDCRFVLVTGESDWTVPSDFRAEARALVESGKLIRWFSTHYDRSEYTGVMTGLPLGVAFPRANDLVYRHGYGLGAGLLRVDRQAPRDAEARWDSIRRSSPPLAGRIQRAYADFHLNDTSSARRYGESRADIVAQLAGNKLVVLPPRQMRHDKLLQQYARHAFVISPHGRGLDTYRTWEVLLMGSIPIVKTSPLDYLYAELPVVIVEDWREIDAAHLATWLDLHAQRFAGPSLRDALSQHYWWGRITEHRRATA